MKQPTTISIIISSYNQGQYLEAAIQSVLAQDYPNTELIVIDGGSQDNSLDILKQYAPQIAYWESVPDRGQSHAINKGFAKASGGILTFLSSDDYYLPGTFDDVVNHFTQNPQAGAVVGSFCFLDQDQSTPGPPIKPFLQGSSPTDLSLGPPGKYRLHQVATFYRRSALEQVGAYVREDMHYVMDRDLLYRVCKAFPITLSEKPYGVFRKHQAGKSEADIIPFAQEFSNLYLQHFTGDKKLDLQRKQMARYRLSRGYIKFSQTTSLPRAFLALFYAGLIQPHLFFERGYWAKFIHAIRSSSKDNKFKTQPKKL